MVDVPGVVDSPRETNLSEIPALRHLPWGVERADRIVATAVFQLGAENVVAPPLPNPRNTSFTAEIAGLTVLVRVDGSVALADRVAKSAEVLARHGFVTPQRLGEALPVGKSGTDEAVSVWELLPHDPSLDPRGVPDTLGIFKLLGANIRDFHNKYTPEMLREGGVAVEHVADQWRRDLDERLESAVKVLDADGNRVLTDSDAARIRESVDGAWEALREGEQILVRSEVHMGNVKHWKDPAGKMHVRVDDLEWARKGPPEWDHMALLVASLRSAQTKRTPQNYADFAAGYGRPVEQTQRVALMLKMRAEQEFMSTLLRPDPDGTLSRGRANDVMAIVDRDPMELLRTAMGIKD